MKQKAKKIILLIFILILAIEFFIYYSDFNLATDITLEFGIATLLVSIGVIFIYLKKRKFRILTGLPTIIIGIVFLFFEFIGAFAGSEKVSLKWNIGEYEIIYANMEYYAGPGDKPYFKLRKKYFFDQIYKTYDKQKTEKTFLELGFGKEHCNLRFKKTGIEFDLCAKRRLN